MNRPLGLALLLAFALAGCGTTRWTDTTRTATEQLLISDAIDRSVSKIDFNVLSGQTVYLDAKFLSSAVDREYLVSTLRQHMLASGCTMKEKKEDADFVVEARAGAIGTDRHDLLYGMPSFSLPWTPMTGGSAVVPEIALAKRTDQKGVAKVAVFAYHRTTGQPVWQSGTDMVASTAQNSWWMGIGPVQKGTIYDKAQFAGSDLQLSPFGGKPVTQPPVRVTRETTFNDPKRFAMNTNDPLAKFTESLAGQRPSTTEPSIFSTAAFDSGFPSPSAAFGKSDDWLSDPPSTPVSTPASGAIISSTTAANSSTSGPLLPTSTASTGAESTPFGRLIGLSRR
jgi:hypothetical protein